MRKLEILCDLDSVVADLMTPWLSVYNKDYSDNLKLENILAWDTHLFVKPECGIKLYDYLTPDLFDSLEPLPGAVQAVNLMSRYHQVHFVTAAPGGTESAKVAWVKRLFPQLGRNIIICKDKWKVAGDVLIDDADSNLVAYKNRWPEARTVTMTYCYNCKEDAVPSIDFQAASGFDTETAWKQIIGYISFLE